MKIQILASLTAFSLTSCMVKPTITNHEEVSIQPILLQAIRKVIFQ